MKSYPHTVIYKGRVVKFWSNWIAAGRYEEFYGEANILRNPTMKPLLGNGKAWRK